MSFTINTAGSARYLFSPVIAGALLAVSDIKLLLIIDICTFFITAAAAAEVRRSIATEKTETKEPFFTSMKEGWSTLKNNRGVLKLVIISSFITMFVGIFQILAEPMILSFSDAATLGTAETVCAGGMLVSGLILGVRGIKGHYAVILSAALALSGVFMAGFSPAELIVPVCIFGFLFFSALPFANNCLDYLVRRNIPADLQGRTWGLVGFISQLGYVAAYSVSGISADILGAVTGQGVGRGAALVVFIVGICLSLIALSIPLSGSIRSLEKE